MVEMLPFVLWRAHDFAGVQAEELWPPPWLMERAAEAVRGTGWAHEMEVRHPELHINIQFIQNTKSDMLIWCSG